MAEEKKPNSSSWRTTWAGRVTAMGVLFGAFGLAMSGHWSEIDWASVMAAVGAIAAALGASQLGRSAKDEKAAPTEENGHAAWLMAAFLTLLILVALAAGCQSPAAYPCAQALARDLPILHEHMQPRDDLTDEQRADVKKLIELTEGNARMLAELLR